MVLVFYISSHGFGHATRDIEVINEIIRRRPEARIVVRTSTPAWFIDQSARGEVVVQPVETDTGIVQIDSLRLDVDNTARAAARFYADFEARVAAEAACLRALEPSIVVGDIPPLAFSAADRIGVPSVALGNFTWDWIYAGYPQFETLARGVVGLVGRSYARASGALRLPFHGGFASMSGVTDIPLIARRSVLGRDTTRRRLELPAADVVVLASFGGHGLALDYATIAHDGRFRLIVTDHESADASSALLRLTTRDVRERGLRYEDLVAASDVVVSKPGYGIVSECIANGAALLYTSRGSFREHEVFVAQMPQVLRCRYLAQPDLLEGKWGDAIEALLGQDPPPLALPSDGAARAAEAILKRL